MLRLVPLLAFLSACFPGVAFSAESPIPVDRISAFVQQEMALQKVPGVAVAVVQGGKTRVARGFGLANVELGVPVGVVTADWGGTPVESWMSAQGLAKFPEFSGALESLAASVDPNLRWERQRASGSGWWDGADSRGPRRVAAGWNATAPGAGTTMPDHEPSNTAVLLAVSEKVIR